MRKLTEEAGADGYILKPFSALEMNRQGEESTLSGRRRREESTVPNADCKKTNYVHSFTRFR